ncbi:PDR/VanB family oxidoreductase [Sphingobium fluviale]|uniref:Oxidoreductase n=1 Tax=Sphingobium fluviale TaxID=2506423 RepID=A0A4Q1KL76_9SPHN|nr:PDR/VanB family oxidoreductase [Sphingobium fluviale]RXR30472.1 oxidoreductase [Sphingobium fluviale]
MNDWIRVRITERRMETDDVAAFVLEPALGAALPAYEAGAHIDVKLPNGLIRQYSLCGTPDRSGRYEIGVLCDASGRGGSICMHENVRLDDQIEISPPRNLFPLASMQERALLFAGGIGVTPILAMAQQLARLGTNFAMHYCARSTSRAAFRERIAVSPFADRVTFHFDDQPETVMDAKALLASPEAGTHLYVCGPSGFMDHILNTARAAGWAESNIHYEHFSAPAGGANGQDGFEIEVADDGTIIPVAQGQTALEALRSAGFDIPASCEQGICGACITTVVDGIPDHRDMYLSVAEQEANDCFTPCCSRALTPRLTIKI